MSKEPKHTPDCTFQLDGGGVCDCGYHKKPKVELSKTDINTCPKCGREQFQWSGRGKIWECLYSNCGYHQRETKAELAEITKTNVAFLVDRQRMAEATMSDWPKEMNATELQFYHRSAYSLPVAFRLACREIDRLTTELAKPHFGMADARAEALTKQIAAWTAEVALANANLKIIQTAKERRLEAELEHYRKRAIEFSNDVKKVEAELAESKTLTEIACSLLEDADAENKRLREALKPIYEHCKNNMQICGIVEQAKAALKGE